MTYYALTLRIPRVLSVREMAALAATCPDAGVMTGHLDTVLTFVRPAGSRREAVYSAIGDVQAALARTPEDLEALEVSEI